MINLDDDIEGRRNFLNPLTAKDDLEEISALFPGQNIGQAWVVMHLYIAYAMAKEQAELLRLSGNIKDAVQVEQTCDRIYDAMPDWAKW